MSNLSALNMGLNGVPGLQNFQHSDVLEKIKMQVRDMKVGFMNSDFSGLHPSFTSTLQNSLGFNNHQAQSLTQHQAQLPPTNDTPNGFPFASPTAPNKDGNTTVNWRSLIKWLIVFYFCHQHQAQTHRHQAKHPIRHSKTMDGALRNNSNKWDRWVCIHILFFLLFLFLSYFHLYGCCWC